LKTEFQPPIQFAASDRHYWLLTGVTGLVGQYLLRDLLRAGQPVAVLVRPDKRASATERVEAIMQRWERADAVQLPRPVVLSGDVRSPRLGLSTEAELWCREYVGHCLHNAAVLKFFGPSRSGEPWQTNVEGTRQVLDWVVNQGIEDFHYVSTAYVAGRTADRVMEADYPTAPQFRNDYEHSKWVAEGLVRAAPLRRPATIYRPVVIAGDSETGYTSSYHGLYLYLRSMALLVPEQPRDTSGRILTPIRLPMSGDQPRNIVPVEWVSAVITHLARTPAAHGQTFHLAPEQGITPRQLIEYCYAYFGSGGVEFCTESDEAAAPAGDFAAKMLDAMKIYQDYDNTDPHFDTTQLTRMAGHLPCPVLDQAVVTRYLKFGERDRWGKARPAAVQHGLSGRQVMERLAEEISDVVRQLDVSAEFGERRVIGSSRLATAREVRHLCFQLLGPGGGPFTMSIAPDGQTTVRPGLMVQPEALLRMTVSSLQSWLSIGDHPWRQTTAHWWRSQTAAWPDDGSAVTATIASEH
jgi:thioester reductase-like protein